MAIGNPEILVTTSVRHRTRVNRVRLPKTIATIAALVCANVFCASLSTTTYLGGSGPDLAKAIAFDAAKNVYIASSSASANFPGLTANSFAGFLYKGSAQCVVTKMDPAATHVLSSILLPPPGFSSAIYFDGVKTSDVAWKDRDCNPTAIHVDKSGNILVAGSTGILHITGDANHDAANLRGSMMGFITKLDGKGNVLYSTVLGAYSNSRTDGKNHYTGEKSKTFISSLAVDSAGRVYVGGWTDSQALPATEGAMQETVRANDVAGFASAINTDGSVMASTFLGGSPTETSSLTATTHVNEITFDSAGNLVVVGSTDSPNLAITPDAIETAGPRATKGFAEVISSDLKKLVYGSFIRPGLDAKCLANLSNPFSRRYISGTEATGVASDNAGNLFVVGTTTSPCLPVTAGAVQKEPRAESAGYLLRLNAKRSLDYATYLDLGGDLTSSMKVLIDTTTAAGADTSIYLAHNAVGAQPTLWPAYSSHPTQIPDLKTANVFLEHLTVTADAASSAVEAVTGFGGTYSTVMFGVAASDDWKTLAVAGTTKTGDLPASAGSLSTTNHGANDGAVALFTVP
jgi:Beta-propeller repeat